MKLYSLNKHYFDIIDTHEKAYILGFIFADGGITTYRLDFSQHAKRRDILEYIKNCLNYSGPIIYDQLSKLNEKTFLRDRLQISNKYLVQSLHKYGIHSNKSLTLEAPKNLKNEYFGAFIRGVFDGDGSANLYKYPSSIHYNPKISFNGTWKLNEFIKEILKVERKILKKNKISRLEITKQSEILFAINKMNESPFGTISKNNILDKLAAFCERSRMKTQNNGESLDTRQDNPVAETPERLTMGNS